MFPVEPGGRPEGQEELAACSIIPPYRNSFSDRKSDGEGGKRLTVRVGSRVGHGEDTGSYEPQFRVDLVRTLHRPS